LEIGGVWNRRKCIIASGGWTPLMEGELFGQL